MAFGGIDVGVSLGAPNPVSAGVTSTPPAQNLHYVLMGVVLVEAAFLVYGRRVFRNYHGG